MALGDILLRGADMPQRLTPKEEAETLSGHKPTRAEGLQMLMLSVLGPLIEFEAVQLGLSSWLPMRAILSSLRRIFSCN